jgi:hypothetical protein
LTGALVMTAYFKAQSASPCQLPSGARRGWPPTHVPSGASCGVTLPTPPPTTTDAERLCVLECQGAAHNVPGWRREPGVQVLMLPVMRAWSADRRQRTYADRREQSARRDPATRSVRYGRDRGLPARANDATWRTTRVPLGRHDRGRRTATALDWQEAVCFPLQLPCGERARDCREAAAQSAAQLRETG